MSDVMTTEPLTISQLGACLASVCLTLAINEEIFGDQMPTEEDGVTFMRDLNASMRILSAGFTKDNQEVFQRLARLNVAMFKRIVLSRAKKEELERQAQTKAMAALLGENPEIQ